jgi:hypothetical protein
MPMICSSLNLLFFTLRLPSATSLLRKTQFRVAQFGRQGHLRSPKLRMNPDSKANDKLEIGIVKSPLLGITAR